MNEYKRYRTNDVHKLKTWKYYLGENIISVPLQNLTHPLNCKYSHGHIRTKHTLIGVHTWVFTSCCARDKAWMILIPDPQPVLSHSIHTYKRTHILSWYLLSIPRGCHGVPMATYIYTTWLQRRGRPQFSSSCGFWMHAHTKATEPRGERETERNEGREARKRQKDVVFHRSRIGDTWAQYSICLQLLGAVLSNSAYALMLMLPAM